MPQLFHLIQSVKLNAFKACNIPAKEWKDFVRGKIVVCHGPAFHIMEVSIARKIDQKTENFTYNNNLLIKFLSHFNNSTENMQILYA